MFRFFVCGHRQEPPVSTIRVVASGIIPCGGGGSADGRGRGARVAATVPLPWAPGSGSGNRFRKPQPPVHRAQVARGYPPPAQT